MSFCLVQSFFLLLFKVCRFYGKQLIETICLKTAIFRIFVTKNNLHKKITEGLGLV